MRQHLGRYLLGNYDLISVWHWDTHKKGSIHQKTAYLNSSLFNEGAFINVVFMCNASVLKFYIRILNNDNSLEQT